MPRPGLNGAAFVKGFRSVFAPVLTAIGRKLWQECFGLGMEQTAELAFGCAEGDACTLAHLDGHTNIAIASRRHERGQCVDHAEQGVPQGGKR